MDRSFPAKLRAFAEFSFLYFLQGMPYGFQVKYLPLLMRQYGYELSNISFLNLVSLPWILKFTWAKLFDRFENFERFWISGCLMFLSLISVSFTMHATVPTIMPVLFLLMSFLSASLDIAVDVLVIRIFEEKDLGYCNIGHIVGYKFGILFGGGMLSVFNLYISLYQFTVLVSVVYLLTAIYFSLSNSALFIKTVPLRKLPVKDRRHCISTRKVTMWIASSPEQLWLLSFVFFYKMGEQGFVSMYPLYLIDNGMTVTHIGIVTGIIGQLFSITGSSIGGLIISKYRLELNSLLLLLAFLKWALLVVYTIFLTFITSIVTLHVTIESIFQLLAGMMTTTTFTYMMISSKRLAREFHAIHFTVISAFEVIGKLFVKSFAGSITQHVGYNNFFASCCGIDSLVVFMALWNVKSRFANIKAQKTE